jgi:DNA-binding MarR family transcriptional regulator
MENGLDRLIIEVRRAFQALRAVADDLHADLGVTAAMRAVMEHLGDGTPRTVPRVAREKGVTRQHIQQIVNALYAAGLAEARENASHRRSPLVALTPRGEAVFAEIRERESVVLADLGSALNDEAVTMAAATLQDLTDELERKYRHD